MNATDVIFARGDITSPFTALQLITPPPVPAAAAVRTPRAPLPMNFPRDATANDDPYQLTPLDFQLANQTIIGENQHDVGIDVKFVGPGSAYESWTKTVAYRSWQSRVQHGPQMSPDSLIEL